MLIGFSNFTVVTLLAMLSLSPSFAKAQVTLSEADFSSLLSRVQVASLQQSYQGEFVIDRDAGRLDVFSILNVYSHRRTRRHMQNMNQERVDIVRDADKQYAIYPGRREIHDLPINDANFPGLFLLKSKHVAQYYKGIDTKQTDRVANQDCQRYNIEPRRADRYGFVVCIEPKSGLLLKLTIRDTKNKALDQMMFTSVRIGSELNPQQLGPDYQYSGFARKKAQHEEKAALSLAESFDFPAGFQIVATSSVQLGTKQKVTRLTLTDGLSSFSIFVRKLKGEQDDFSNETFTVADSVSVVSQRQGSYVITALGLMPRETLSKVIQTAKLPTINKTN